MSFILEALKKVDRRKDDPAQDGVVMQGGRRWGDTSFPGAITTAVLVAVAALALASVALLRSFRGGETGAPEQPATAAVAGQADPASFASAPSERNESLSATVASPAPAATDSVPRGDRTEAAEIIDPSRDAVTEEPNDVVEPATAPPVTLVGRASGDLAPSAASEADGQPPSELPPLVLQGTSVIDGKAVAVVNYQRLFEGDLIEGARVVKILDRAVELEFKGTHFTIRL